MKIAEPRYAVFFSSWCVHRNAVKLHPPRTRCDPSVMWVQVLQGVRYGLLHWHMYMLKMWCRRLCHNCCQVAECLWSSFYSGVSVIYIWFSVWFAVIEQGKSPVFRAVFVCFGGYAFHFREVSTKSNEIGRRSCFVCPSPQKNDGGFCLLRFAGAGSKPFACVLNVLPLLHSVQSTHRRAHSVVCVFTD